MFHNCFIWYSYEKNYKKLLENMLKNDLALKGFIDEVELLIFPSDKLPENSQRKYSISSSSHSL